MLSILDGVLSQLKGCEGGTLPELLADVLQLINKHPFVQVLAGATACLTTLAAKEPAAAAALASSASVYAAWLRDQGQGTASPALLCRFLYILGQLCRRGADVLEATPPEGGGPPLAMAECQRIFVQYCGARENVKVRMWYMGCVLNTAWSGVGKLCWRLTHTADGSAVYSGWECRQPADSGTPPLPPACPRPHRWRRRRWVLWAAWP